MLLSRDAESVKPPSVEGLGYGPWYWCEVFHVERIMLFCRICLRVDGCGVFMEVDREAPEDGGR